MTYDPKKHHRRSIRLKGYDYATPGWYYLTICTHERELLFGEIVDSQMRQSSIGAIAQACWNEIPQHFRRATLDLSIVMPNHLHGIVVIGTGTPSASTGTPSERTGTPWRAPTRTFGKPVPGSLATIVGLFKQAVTTRARNLAQTRDDIVGARDDMVGARHGVPLQVWQENYHEHVIRNENELNRIREYICNNPLRWPYDPENPARHDEADDDIEDILDRG